MPSGKTVLELCEDRAQVITSDTAMNLVVSSTPDEKSPGSLFTFVNNLFYQRALRFLICRFGNITRRYQVCALFSFLKNSTWYASALYL